MIKHIWTVICRKSTVDQESNNISLIEVVEQVTISGKQKSDSTEILVPMDFEIISLWSRDCDGVSVRGTAKIILINPNNEEITIKEIDIDLTVYKRLRTRIKFATFGVKYPGRHEFKVFLKNNSEWNEVANIPVQIDVEPQKEINAGQSG